MNTFDVKPPQSTISSNTIVKPENENNSNDDSVQQIQRNLMEDWKIVNSIPQLLIRENAFCAKEHEWFKEKVVDFVKPEELKKLIDLSIVENQCLSLDEIREICSKVIHYSVKTSHGRFHNQLFGQVDPYGLAGTWISEALNTSAYTFEVAPVFSLIETEIIRKASELCGYKNGDGIFAPGGSISNMYALVLARYKYFPEVKNDGMTEMKTLVLYTSEESHYSFKKSAHWLGIGMKNCITIKTNERGQMLIDDLESKIQQTLKESKIPFFVNATAGSTVLGAFDNLDEIANICIKYNLWMHVDACLGGSLLLSYKYRHQLKGIERANSFSWNPHKSLGAPLQCSLFMTSEIGLLARSNSIEVNYLFQQDKFYDVSYDTGNKSVQCGRKVDAFKFWLMLKARGYGTFGHLIDYAIDTSKLFLQKLVERGEERGFRLVLNEFQYSNICFWYIPKMLRNQEESDEWQQQLNLVAPKIKEQMTREGTLMIGYCPLKYLKNTANFFRMIFTCFPIISANELDFILNEIERLGESLGNLSNGIN